MAPSTNLITSDEVDDLIYFSRTGDLSSLQELVQSISRSHNCSPSQIVRATIDVDEEGLGSGSCLLHYPAANGALEIVQYLLTQLQNDDCVPAKGGNKQATGEGALGAAGNFRKTDFVNHKNVSGNTPLHWAGINGHIEIVKVLLDAGADPELVNSAGRDAVVESEYSSKEGASDCAVWMLRECGALERGVGEDTHENDAQDEENEDDDPCSSNKHAGDNHQDAE